MDRPKSTLPTIRHNGHLPPEVVDHAPTATSSAIATFSRSISSLDLTYTSPSPRLEKRCYVDSLSTGASLPTEILIIIFQLVFETCVSSCGAEDYDPTWMASWLEDDPLSPTLFPYSLASVCVRWLHILAGIPIYWTRLVITVDTLVTSPIAIRGILDWVGDHPLQVIMTRHRTPSEEPDLDEYTRVQTILDLLRPHICHIRSLTLDVKHNSSLPALWRECVYARYLRLLTLMSDRSIKDNMVPPLQLPEPGSPGGDQEDEPQLQAPILTEVTLSRPFFEETLMDQPLLIDWFKYITCLTVCGCTSIPGDELSLYGFLRVLEHFSSVETLTLEDMAFIDDLPLWAVTLRPTTLYLRKLTSKGCTLSILTRTVTSTEKEAITIVDAFVEVQCLSLDFTSSSLTLQDMHADAALTVLVSRWNGDQLSLINCPGATDTFLEREVAPIDLQHLSITDCEHVSAQGLVGLVRSRNALTTPVLDTLHVRGRGPSIGVNESQWLAKHVERFSWDTVAKDGSRYFWDAVTRELVVSPVESLSESGSTA